MTNKEKYNGVHFAIELAGVYYEKNRFIIEGNIVICTSKYDEYITIHTTIPSQLIDKISPYQALCMKFKKWLKEEYGKE